jgi:peptidyl-prolyl cis-trans isomerase-like 4
LNPITMDQDLELIFSRFGPIKKCEIIRDKRTGDSLQYAFIEFQDIEACEKAYQKMDQVLIDDRRIRVDFSQSVSHMYYKWKQ